MRNTLNRLEWMMILGIFASALFPQETGTIQNVKAVFIYNFTKYMKWTGQEQSSTFNIAVIGESPVLEPLKQIALKRRVNQKEIQISHIKNADQMDMYHILFIPESEKTGLKTIVNRIQGKNILIVSEIEGALSSGVMINLLISQKTIKFEINAHAMKQSGFQPGSELLKLAVRLIE